MTREWYLSGPDMIWALCKNAQIVLKLERTKKAILYVCQSTDKMVAVSWQDSVKIKHMRKTTS